MSEAKPKIFALVIGGHAGWLNVKALAEDGEVLAGHVSSTVEFAKHDIGVTSDWKHEHYQLHYPRGYEVEWVDNWETHPGFQAAYQKYLALHPELVAE